jgi:hypothetical protein
VLLQENPFDPGDDVGMIGGHVAAGVGFGCGVGISAVAVAAR